MRLFFIFAFFVCFLFFFYVYFFLFFFRLLGFLLVFFFFFGGGNFFRIDNFCHTRDNASEIFNKIVQAYVDQFPNQNPTKTFLDDTRYF